MATAIATTYAPETTSRSLFSNRTFLALWIGQAVSVIGDGFHSVALGLWVLQTTGSATAMATIMTVKMLITVLLGSVAGAVVDRTDRRQIMLGMNLARFALVTGVALLVARQGTALLPIVLLSAVISVCGNFFGPAFQASLITIVEKDQIQKASSLLQVTNTLAGVLGPALGGAVVAAFGGWVALSVDALSFLFGAIMVWLGGAFPSPRRDGARTSLVADLKDGFAQIKRVPVAWGAVTIAPFLNFFAAAIILLIPVIAVKVWQASAGQYGTMQAAFPMGAALGGVLIMAMSRKMTHRGWWIGSGILVSGLGFTAAALAGGTAMAMPVLLVTGFFNAITNVLMMVILQQEIAPEAQGRVFGTLNSLCGLASPAAMMVAGILADRFSPVLLAGVAGTCMVLVGIAAVAGSRAMRTYN